MARPRRSSFVITIALSATSACGGSTSGESGAASGGKPGVDAGGLGGAGVGGAGVGGAGVGGVGLSGGVGGAGFGGGGIGGGGIGGGNSTNPPSALCPTAIPENGTLCQKDTFNPGPFCDYDDPCGGPDQIVATCTGVWEVPNTDCSCECPEQKPPGGTPCDPCIVDVCSWGDCSRDVEYSGQCVNGVWETEMHSCF
jgi:hypothetical protein